jgi:spoIIIJ-associated protein
MAFRYFTGGKFDAAAFAADLTPLLRRVIESMRLDLRFDVQLYGGAGAGKAAGTPPGGVEPGQEPPAAEAAADAPAVEVLFSGRDTEMLLERSAELLLAIEYLMLRCLRLDPQAHELVRFDAGDYRATRLAELRLSAQVAAQRVRELHQPFPMSPMPARERRLVHLALANEKGVRTSSEGEGERRHIVIYPTESARRR